jgi:hypothetical protein
MRVERVSPAGRVPERGVALIAALLIMLLMSALMIGFTTVVMTDQRYRGIDKDRTRAFYGAQSGLEKLTADIGTLFLVNVAPTPAQIAALSTQPPTISGVTFTAPAGITAYGATKVIPPGANANGSVSGTIQKGPYQGLIALKTYYDLDVVAKTTGGGEAHLKRRIETVAIPVFQFGMFSDVDLAFFAGPNFDFGGRVHTNGNLFLSQDSPALWLRDKVTAVREIVRQRLQNGASIDTSPTHNGRVSMATSTNTFRDLGRTEGSVVDGVNSALNNNWPTVSLSTYNGYIRNGRTGAKALNLPLLTAGGANTDLVRRPAVNEDVNDPTLYGERYYSRVSLRILLSDTANDIMNLPGIDTTLQPVRLENWSAGNTTINAATPPAGYTVDATHPPLALSPGYVTMATAGATVADGDVTVNAAIPNAWPLNPSTLTVLRGSPLVVQGSLNCASMSTSSPWRFNTCKNPAGGNTVSINSGDTISLIIGGVTVASTTTTAAVTGAASVNVTVNSVSNFSAYNTFWLNDTLVTCRWVDVATNAATPKFTLCKGTPVTAAGATISTNALSAKDAGTIGGWIKIERQDTSGVFRDVTAEILAWGIAASNVGGVICSDPNPNAIIRLQRLKDNGTGTAACPNAGSTNPYDYWPNVLFDPREGLQRDTVPGAPNAPNLNLAGVMHYVTLDVANLAKWFKGQAPYAAGTGITVKTDNGYSLYFSDRRNNRDSSNKETGEYGFEDFVNPSTGTPNGTLDAGEDVNANNQLDTYGQYPSYQGNVNALPPGSGSAPAPFNSAGAVRPTAWMTAPQAKVNREYLFRRAVKLVRGDSNSINVLRSGLAATDSTGLSIAVENPVYIQGNWNADQANTFNGTHVATSVVADAVTLLSNNWTDQVSFTNPYAPGNRQRTTTYYRVAIIAGKGMSFPQPSGTATDFGTDGGAHNFLRYLESGDTVYFRGSIATFFYNRQALGTYKCCTTVYGAPQRQYNFDTDFLDPAKLPPLTPVFRDVNSLGFTQEIRPGK